MGLAPSLAPSREILSKSLLSRYNMELLFMLCSFCRFSSNDRLNSVVSGYGRSAMSSSFTSSSKLPVGGSSMVGRDASSSRMIMSTSTYSTPAAGGLPRRSTSYGSGRVL